MARVLVACVGNVLRGDDGFGQAVERQLRGEGTLPDDVDLIETGIGGMSIVHQLMQGYEALIVVDAVELGQRPGTVFVLEPEVPEPASLDVEEWRARFSNLHLAEPSRVFLLARSLGVLPPYVRIVGCQPLSCEEYATELSPPVAAAVEVASRRVVELAGAPSEVASPLLQRLENATSQAASFRGGAGIRERSHASKSAGASGGLMK